MKDMKDWNINREMWIAVLKKQTNQGLEEWQKRLADQKFEDEKSLRDWLTAQGVTGYAATLLVMEKFGYPDFVTASAADLLEAQYADRPHLRPIYDAIITAVSEMGDFTIQMRKSYVSLLTPRRTFARIRPSTKNRVDLGLRLPGHSPGGRLKPCNMQATMKVQISLSTIEEVDADALAWLRLAYKENC